jgi:hypothetical protein
VGGEGKCVHLAKEFDGFAVKTAVLPLKVERCEAVPREAAEDVVKPGAAFVIERRTTLCPGARRRDLRRS